ncbi:helix-turn-helix domain-containing protein [bacterium]|nr:helix-turn-helix domain-containing protein [bacterium]
MIKIFNGNWRGPGDTDKKIGMLLEFNFREILNQFKGAKLAVFLAISLHANEDGVSYPSYDLIQKETGYTRGSVAKALKELCETEIDGFPVLTRIRYRDKKGQFAGSNRYLVFPTTEEVQSLENELSSTQSIENPPTEKPNGGKTELEVKPELKDKPEDKEEEGEPNIFQLYESSIGPLTGKVGDELKSLEDDYPVMWIEDAFAIAKKNKASHLKYVTAILDRWNKNGKDDGYKKKKKGADLSAFDEIEQELENVQS